MATKKQKFKVILFLVVSISFMLVSTLVISGIYQDPGVHYWLEFNESILGLYEGGMVEYLGVPVGKVSEIYVTNGRYAHVNIVINPKKVTLHEGTEGQLVLYSIASGTMAVSLDGGNLNSPKIEEYKQIPTKTSTIKAFSAQMSKILEDVSAISENISGQIENLDDTAVSDIVHQVRDMLARGDAFVDNTDALVKEATEAVKDVRTHADNLFDTIQKHSEDLETLTNKLAKLLDVSVKRAEELDVKELQEQFNDLLVEITAVAGQVDKTIANMDVIASDVIHQTNNVEFTLRSTMLEMNDTFDSIR
ncbi:MAG: MCE family protein, partial [Candidatus Hydrogenedentes bacterium]|nr:MCE family protein [Candidatus Hydrogenedentota bacterium]